MWFVEIGLIVGEHILALLVAHRMWKIEGSHVLALRSQYALTALMSLYTVATLWLLAQPLVG